MKPLILTTIVIFLVFFIISSEAFSLSLDRRDQRHKKNAKSKIGERFGMFLLRKGAPLAAGFLMNQAYQLAGSGTEKYLDDKKKAVTNTYNTVCNPRFREYGTNMFSNLQNAYGDLANPSLPKEKKLEKFAGHVGMFGFYSFKMYGLYKNDGNKDCEAENTRGAINAILEQAVGGAVNRVVPRCAQTGFERVANEYLDGGFDQLKASTIGRVSTALNNQFGSKIEQLSQKYPGISEFKEKSSMRKHRKTLSEEEYFQEVENLIVEYLKEVILKGELDKCSIRN